MMRGRRGEGPGTSQSQPALRREVRPLPLDAGAEQPRQRAMPRGQRPGGPLVHVHRPHRVRRAMPGHPMHRPHELVLLAQVGQRNQPPGNARTPSAARPRSPPGSASPDRPGSHHPAAAATRRHGPASAPPRPRTAAARTATTCGHAWPQPAPRRRPAPSSVARPREAHGRQLFGPGAGHFVADRGVGGDAHGVRLSQNRTICGDVARRGPS